MSGNDSRARFEVEFVHFSHEKYYDEPNIYVSTHTRIAWSGWQARDGELATLNEQYLALIAVHENLRKEMSAVLKAERERCANHIDVSWERSGHHFAEAIRALGADQIAKELADTIEREKS